MKETIEEQYKRIEDRVKSTRKGFVHLTMKDHKGRAELGTIVDAKGDGDCGSNSDSPYYFECSLGREHEGKHIAGVGRNMTGQMEGCASWDQYDEPLEGSIEEDCY